MGLSCAEPFPEQFSCADRCFVYIYNQEVLRGWKVMLPSHPSLAPAMLFPVERKFCHS